MNGIDIASVPVETIKTYLLLYFNNIHNCFSSKTLRFEWIINGILFVLIESSYWWMENRNEVSKLIVSNQVTKASKYQMWAWWIALENWACLLGPKGMKASPFQELARYEEGSKKWRSWVDTWSNPKRQDRSSGLVSFRSIYCIFSVWTRVTNFIHSYSLKKIPSTHAVERKEFNRESNVCLCTIYFVIAFTFKCKFTFSQIFKLSLLSCILILLFRGDSE